LSVKSHGGKKRKGHLCPRAGKGIRKGPQKTIEYASTLLLGGRRLGAHRELGNLNHAENAERLLRAQAINLYIETGIMARRVLITGTKEVGAEYWGVVQKVPLQDALMRWSIADRRKDLTEHVSEQNNGWAVAVIYFAKI